MSREDCWLLWMARSGWSMTAGKETSHRGPRWTRGGTDLSLEGLHAVENSTNIQAWVHSHDWEAQGTALLWSDWTLILCVPRCMCTAMGVEYMLKVASGYCISYKLNKGSVFLNGTLTFMTIVLPVHRVITAMALTTKVGNRVCTHVTSYEVILWSALGRVISNQLVHWWHCKAWRSYARPDQQVQSGNPGNPQLAWKNAFRKDN